MGYKGFFLTLRCGFIPGCYCTAGNTAGLAQLVDIEKIKTLKTALCQNKIISIQFYKS